MNKASERLRLRRGSGLKLKARARLMAEKNQACSAFYTKDTGRGFVISRAFAEPADELDFGSAIA